MDRERLRRESIATIPRVVILVILPFVLFIACRLMGIDLYFRLFAVGLFACAAALIPVFVTTLWLIAFEKVGFEFIGADGKQVCVSNGVLSHLILRELV